MPDPSSPPAPDSPPDPSSPPDRTARLRVTETRPRPGVAVVRPVGEMDAVGAPLVTERIAELALPCECLVLDMRRVEFLDAGGIHALLDAARTARRCEVQLIIVGLDPAHHRVLRICGVESELTLADVVDAELVAGVALPFEEAVAERDPGPPVAGS
ncbi:STAS domain-containing protein [Pseudonocardia sp. KRD291]|uniref:STAS domain-containing protein n=1 Tax=Pseudonocardia sp. KRD291 TaxID=2792007 RepID=UPI001C4A3064|nr:STAS domain-containing protein [Pseudonocardia sp. KRD291]MBW0105830.1 STAS domain-containing protein [Pseudonocardia sp. KRD291]